MVVAVWSTAGNITELQDSTHHGDRHGDIHSDVADAVCAADAVLEGGCGAIELQRSGRLDAVVAATQTGAADAAQSNGAATRKCGAAERDAVVARDGTAIEAAATSYQR